MLRILLVFFLFPPPFILNCRAQDMTYHGVFYSLKSGLSSYNVSSIVQDKYGFSWIATQDGLNFFDGLTFKVFNKNSNNGLAGSDIRNIVYDRQRNLLWIVFSYGGINAINCQTHEIVLHLPQSKFLNFTGSTNLTSVSLTSENKLLVLGNKTCHLYDPDKNKISTLFNGLEILKNDQIITTISDSREYYFLFIEKKGIICISKKSNKLSLLTQDATTNSNAKYPFFSKCTFIKNDTIYYATHEGIFYITKDLKTILKLKTESHPDIFTFDHQNSIWYCSANKLWKSQGLSQYNIKFEPEDNLPSTQYYLSLTFDKKNNLWIGGSEGAIFSNLTPPGFTRFSSTQEKRKMISHLYDVLPTDSLIYLNDLKGLIALKPNTHEYHAIDTSGFPFFLMNLPDNGVLFNNQKGFFLIKEKSASQTAIYQKFPELKKIHGRLIACHVNFNDSVIILGGEDFKGIIYWDIKNHRIFEIPPI
ncbi:MAG: hypothetical protein IPG86_17915 [Chitinophagaceae bacterium]|nr:hypothetical protein [Chitinophagaceae bacterium]